VREVSCLQHYLSIKRTSNSLPACTSCLSHPYHLISYMPAAATLLPSAPSCSLQNLGKAIPAYFESMLRCSFHISLPVLYIISPSPYVYLKLVTIFLD